MSHRNKGKGAASSRPTQQVKTQTKSAPLPKAAPPPPKLTPSQRLRQEWKSFETWYTARREEKDKRVSERINEIISPKGRSKFHKPAPPSGSMDIKGFEAAQNHELAEKARAEWLKRLEAVGLNEEDWIDITPQEMEAIEAAFMPPGPSEGPMGTSGMNPQTTPSAQDKVEPWLSSVPGAWETARSSSTKLASTKSPPMPSVPERTTYTPIISDKKPSRTVASGLPTPELLWEMNMLNKTGQDIPLSPVTTKLGPSDMRRTGSAAKTGSLASSVSSPTTPSTNESLWDMYARTSTSSLAQEYSSEETMKDKRKSKVFAGEHLFAPPESPWAAYEASKAGAPPAIQKTNVLASDTPESLWNKYLSKPPVDDHIPSPVLTETPEEPPSPSYVYLSPVLVELEEEDPENLGLLPEKVAETSIKEFHQMAAEADIELRRKLLKGEVDPQEYDQLLEDHLNNMEKRCREVVEKWKKDREAEKQRRVAEEKKRQAEIEKKKLAETKKQAVGGKWGQTAKGAAARVKSPEPQPKKGQTKANQKSRKVTVEEVPDVDESETSSFFGSGRNDTPEMVPEEIPANVRPSKTPQSNFLSNVWGARTMGSRTSSPAPGKRLGEEQKKAPAPSKNPFSSQAPAPAESNMTPWESRMWNATLNKGQERSQSREQEQSLWESAAQEEDESPSLWETAGAATRGMWNMAANAFGGERSATPTAVTQTRTAYSFPPNEDMSNAWISEDSTHRSMSRGPVAEDTKAPGKNSRYQMWRPDMNGQGGKDNADEAESTVKKMAELAFQNLADVTEEQSSPSEVLDAMSMYTKAAATSNKKRGQGRRR